MHEIMLCSNKYLQFIYHEVLTILQFTFPQNLYTECEQDVPSAKCLYQVRVITVFTVFRLLTDFVCLYNYEFLLSLCKIVRSSVILLVPVLISDS